MSTVSTDKLLIVDSPAMQPGFCMATLSHEDPKGFVDTLNIPAVIDPRVYISVSWIEETARKLGMDYPPEDGGVQKRVEDLEEQLREADKQLYAIDMMESAGYVARKKAAPRQKAEVKVTKHSAKKAA